MRFTHPLFASVCYEIAPAAQRRAAHQALADATADLEERARHLALAAVEPNAGVAAALDEAVARAAGRGAPAAAAELSEHAGSLTPLRDSAHRRRRRLRAAELHNLSGNPERAASLYEELLGEADAGAERADALFGLASTQSADASSFAQLLDEALGEAAGDNARSARILGFRAQVAFVYGGPGASAADARAAFAHAKRAGDPLPLAVAIAHLGQLETYTLDVTPGLLERGIAIEQGLGRPLDFFSSPSAMLAVQLFLNDDLERARALLERAGVGAAERGAEIERAWVLFYLMWLEWLAGRWQVALSHIAEAKELAEQAQDEFLGPQLVNQEAFIEAHLGRIEEARAKAESVLAVFAGTSSEIHRIVCLSTLGHIELALGNLEAANRYLHDLPGQLLSFGWLEPGHPLWPDAIETLVGVGKLDQARVYLEQHERLAARAGRLARGYAPGAAAFWPPPRATWSQRSSRSNAVSPSWAVSTHSSAAAHCSRSAPLAGKRSRSASPARHSSRRWRSSRSSAHGCGRRTRGPSSDGSAADAPARRASPRRKNESHDLPRKDTRTNKSPRHSSSASTQSKPTSPTSTASSRSVARTTRNTDHHVAG